MKSRVLRVEELGSVGHLRWLMPLVILLVIAIAQSVSLAASSHLQSDNHIILPADGQVIVNFVGTGGPGEPTWCEGDFGLYSPQEILIYPEYLYYGGVPFPLPGYFTQGTGLIFYITPRDFCSGGPYLSTDPNRAHITHPDPNTWIIGWEDWIDADFNDLIVRIDFQPATIPFLDLPFDYTGSTFAGESKDTEQGGKINAYFDHQYPTYCAPPNTGGCSSTDTKAVNFYGYDGDPSRQDQPPYNVVYNGHDGIDYYLSHNTPVLAAGDGVVTFAGEISLSCDTNGPSKTIIISHPNGYETQYWHLDHFAEGVAIGAEVSRDVERPIGYVGNTGCATGYHLHFMVKNREEIVVDPYGWNPLRDAAWYGQDDPWQQYNEQQDDPIDATSHYLWIQPLGTVALVDPSAPTVITSTSGHVVATVPAGAYNAPLRIELTETLQSVRIAGYRSLHSFSLAAYTTEDVPIVTLGAEVTLDVSTGGIHLLAMNTGTTPTLQVWDAQTSTWRELPTTWDPLTGSAHATSAQIGTFALSIPESRIYVPAVFRDAP
jgi:murein DD-endopeptidase MepM/ murein hydrolase activator NlpD